MGLWVELGRIREGPHFRARGEAGRATLFGSESMEPFEPKKRRATNLDHRDFHFGGPTPEKKGEPPRLFSFLLVLLLVSA